MNPQRWQRIEEIYHAAIPLAAVQRAAYVSRACEGDNELLAQVQSLLEADDSSGEFLETALFDVGLRVLASDGQNQAEDINEDKTLKALTGRRLDGRYRIDRKLGHGGVGIVYLAHDEKLHDKPVVVKVLLEKSQANQWFMQKFQQEKEALARVDHPGVVGIIDAGELAEGEPFIVMQFVDGISLREAIKEESEGLDLQRVASIVKQVGSALSAVHKKKIYHRDLKPENIMLQRLVRGEEQVKILDFGVAKVRESLIAPSTATGAVSAGTVLYMSPEQLRGDRITAASDIYAFGLIAYEMITGRRPFKPDTVAQLSDMQREGVRVNPGALRPRLPDEAEKLILSALDFDPGVRPQDAAEFGAALALALIGDAETLKLPATTKAPEFAADDVPPLSEQQSLSGSQKAVFISYSQADKKAAQTICRSLEKAGLGCWIAPRNIPPGQTWAEFIPDAIARSSVMVLLLSARANESRQVKKEVDIADNKNIPIIPFRIEDVPLSKALEYHLAGTQWLDAYTPPLSRHLSGLEETVRSMIGQERGDGSSAKARRLPWRLTVAAAAILIVAGIIGGVWKMTAKAQRTLAYSLTVQKMRDGKPYQEHFQSSGQEIFESGYQFRLNVASAQSGYLYVFNEGADANGGFSFTIIYPTPATNSGSARVNANQTIQTNWNEFGGKPGTEQFWMIWSPSSVGLLEAARDAAFKSNGRVADAAMARTVREFITSHSDPALETTKDTARQETHVRGNGDVLVKLVELEHR
jgi:serine/threonine protein kinase